MSDKETKERWVYAGLTKFRTQKYYHLYYVVSRDINEPWETQRLTIPVIPDYGCKAMDVEDYHIFTKKLKGEYGIGSVINVEIATNETGNTLVGTGDSIERVNNWHHPIQWQRWYATNKSLELERAATNKRNKEMRRNPVFEALEPVRKAYKNASSGARVQILAYILERITR